jgi:malonyl CoA-acyl carrier protein transacylase
VRVAAPSLPGRGEFDAQANSDPDRVKESWSSAGRRAVRWEESVLLIADDGVTHALEIGPGKVLAGLVKTHLQGGQGAERWRPRLARCLSFSPRLADARLTHRQIAMS